MDSPPPVEILTEVKREANSNTQNIMGNPPPVEMYYTHANNQGKPNIQKNMVKPPPVETYTQVKSTANSNAQNNMCNPPPVETSKKRAKRKNRARRCPNIQNNMGNSPPVEMYYTHANNQGKPNIQNNMGNSPPVEMYHTHANNQGKPNIQNNMGNSPHVEMYHTHANNQGKPNIQNNMGNPPPVEMYHTHANNQGKPNIQNNMGNSPPVEMYHTHASNQGKPNLQNPQGKAYHQTRANPVERGICHVGNPHHAGRLLDERRYTQSVSYYMDETRDSNDFPIMNSWQGRVEERGPSYDYGIPSWQYIPVARPPLSYHPAYDIINGRFQRQLDEILLPRLRRLYQRFQPY